MQTHAIDMHMLLIGRSHVPLPASGGDEREAKAPAGVRSARLSVRTRLAPARSLIIYLCVIHADTKMVFPGLKKPADRANLIAYLKEATA